MRNLFILLIVTLMTCLPERALAQTPTGQPDFSRTSNYVFLNGFEKDYEKAKTEWESIKDDPNISKSQKDRVSTQMYEAREGLAGLCSRQDFGIACLSIALTERGNITGYIYAELACAAGQDQGCILQAIMDAEGEGRRKSPTLAENILKRNCSPDRLPVCRAYATLLASDQGHPADLPKARETYKSFCYEMEDLESCKSAFELLNAGNPEPETYLQNRLKITRKLCALEPESAMACNHAMETEELLPLIDLDECRTSSSKSTCAGVATMLEQLGPENQNFKDRVMELQAYSCETLRHDQSCLYLTKQDYNIDIVAPHKSKAADALQTVCLNSASRERYIAEACQWSAQQGLALKSDEGYAEARPYLERFCLMNKPSCGTWARMLLEGLGGPVDLPRGRQFMMAACEASNINACLDTAAIINEGIGGEKNPEAAQALLNDICQKGEAKACNFLLELSQTQNELPQTQTELMRLTRLAESGDVSAQTELGLAYDLGKHGATQNKIEAARWYRRAAEQRVPDAQYNLGVKYEKGQGLAQNYQEAAKWYRKAAEQEYALAQVNLGLMHSFGKGIPINKVKGYMWLSLAAAQGQNDGNVNGRLNYIAEDMTGEQIATAKNMVAKCLTSNYNDCD